MTDLLKRQRMEVSVEGPLVILKIGNTEMKMEYDTALQLSTWLRVRGKEAKLNAGDTSSHWSIIGNLKAVLNGERPY